MDLLQNLIDVNCITLLPFALLFLVTLGNTLLRLAGFFGSFTRRLWRLLRERESAYLDSSSVDPEDIKS